ncbi:hypothetical protein [Rhodococcus sp. SGAir0479]|uniref:hypothetical protein n=1 Tax=Rhodococcus sp. SGAir0479 TaxID=2567884 RepID=UPI0010CD34BE|nr:hypothetical protein [Rhodococcus sp. SGAir0479]QCQ89920.1 hypothetical protein E7742_00985 [Rhodococcus sp. SGAir0479]
MGDRPLLARSDGPRYVPQGVLDTAHQVEFEAAVNAAMRSPAVQAARRDVVEMYRTDPQARTTAGAATLERAADSIAVAAAQTVVGDDPARPQFAWVVNAAHRWHGVDVPGSGYGIDNPDNVHRHAAVDGTSSYVVRSRLPDGARSQLSFVLYGELPGTGAVTKEGAPVLGFLTGDRMRIGADGAFTVTISPAPGDDRTDHIRTAGAARLLIVRDSLDDWSTQTPCALTIERVTGPAEAPPRTAAEVADHTAELLRRIGRYWLDYDNAYIYAKPANTVQPPPGLRASGFGFATSGHFALPAGQALVVTLDAVGARYLGFEITDPWGVTREYVQRTGSLNQSQAQHNPDGTITYVIAAADPGVTNWLDTGGIDAGMFAIRWQSVPAGTDVGGAVRAVDLLPVADVPAVLGARATTTADGRRAQLDRRAADYARRLGGPTLR